VLILDTDYDSLVLRTDRPELTQRLLAAWDEHFVHRDLPRRLTGMLRRAGFELESRRVIPLLNTGYDRSEFSYGLVRVMASFASGRVGLSEEDTSAWLADLDDLGRRGEYFFSLNRYLFLARRPA